MNLQQEKQLIQLLALPTAPFREQVVSRYVTGLLAKWKIPFFQDPHGNLVLGVDSRAAYLQRIQRKSSEPVRLFMAHMDHPGFHGVKWTDSNRLAIKWFGGSPVRHLAGQSMRVTNGAGVDIVGRLRNVVLNKHGWALDRGEVVFDKANWQKGGRPVAQELFGGFAFRKPVWKQGKRIYTHAADDLCGVFAILQTVRMLYRGRPSTRKDIPFIGLLTRGEEVGFTGAVAHFRLGWLQQRRRDVICVSLEASRTLPGAGIGKGPVVRLGDRRTVFSHDSLKVLADVAQRTLKNSFQMRVMDGGACEATAAISFGLPSVGITLPLGNYHNQCLDGGLDCSQARGVAPEFVHLGDLAGELKLCQALMAGNLPWHAPWLRQKQQLIRNAEKYKKYFQHL